MNKVFSCICLALLAPAMVQATDLTLRINKNYINLPVADMTPHSVMSVYLGDKLLSTGYIRLTDSNPDYWMFYDVSAYKGKKITLHTDNEISLSGIFQSDSIEGKEPLYNEAFRQQFHFSSKRGWLNDPNGLVYHDGEYHLFYQHNPYEVVWGNMHWGHAVSTDLLHWQELPEALSRDEQGMVFSGSAVIDYKNVSGLGKRDCPAMLAFYTEEMPDGETQFMAYSLDKGRTWTKYEGNPIVDNKMKNGSWHNRDPKVFWFEKGQHWVMAVFEKDGISIYNSEDLLHWSYQSHTAGFWECPELFELPVDGNPDNTRWVMCGASGTYMLGSFDGKTFVPESGKHYYVTGYQYAAQTFNDTPDGRRILIGWASIRKPNMPFTGFMQLPLELTLCSTKDGIRMLANPIKEVEQLFTPLLECHSLTLDQANEKLRELPPCPDGLRVKFRFRLSHPTYAALQLDGQDILKYDLNYNRVNEVFYSPQDPTSMELSADLYIDRSSVEGFIDGGHYTFVMERKAEGNATGLKFWNDIDDLCIENLEVYSAQSIWH